MDRTAGAILIGSGSITLTLLSTADRGGHEFLMFLGLAQVIFGTCLMVDLGAWFADLAKPPKVVEQEDEER